MKMQLRKLHAFVLGVGLAILAFSGVASADPPSRVARLGYMSGAVSFSPAGDDDWVQATLNRPLTTGDRLWADAGSRAEMQIGGAAIRLSANTDLSLLNLDDQIAQLQLTQGVLNVRVRQLAPGQMIEVDTPNLAFTVRQSGAYRVEVDPDGDGTTVIVRSGQGEVYGEGASYVVDARQPYRFTGTGLRQHQYVSAAGLDDFDRWSNDRDRIYETSAPARYVSPDVVGYADLDAYGRWESDPSYGYVWVPTRVRAGWAPYYDGHWVWVDPWGWTWVDDAPWGFAVSHYGRWAHRRGGWCWVPGPVQTRAYYAPALVAFVGGPNFQISITSGTVGGVAWFPLAPREVYRPAYQVSRGYFQNINVSNTVVNTTIINNVYNTTSVTNVVYANRNVPGAVVAVPKTAFLESRSVGREAVRVRQENLVNRAVAIAPSVAPTERSLRGRADVGGKPPVKALERTVVAREAPPPTRPKFAAQKKQLDAHPGRPLDDDARKELKSAPVAAKPNVKVIARNEQPAREKLPPAGGAERKSGDEDRRGDGRRSDQHNSPQAPARIEAPRPPKQAEAPRPPEHAEVPSRVARPPVQREPREQSRAREDQEQIEQRSRKVQNEQRDSHARMEQPRQPLRRNEQPNVVAPATPPSVARPPEERGKSERHDADEQHERRAPKQSALQRMAQVNPPKPDVPPAPEAPIRPPTPPMPPKPPAQAVPPTPPTPAPVVRDAKPPRQEGEAKADQPRRSAPRAQEGVPRAKRADPSEKKEDRK
jgi:hypothetical protein